MSSSAFPLKSVTAIS